MRLWTAIMGWAALMAAAIALYALGVALESKPHAPSSALMASAIGLGAFASLIFAADLVYLARRERRRRRALQEPRREFGRLDYVPELTKASGRYANALQQITDELGRTTEVFTRNRDLTSQDQAVESAEAATQLCQAYEQSLPIVSESGEVATECLKGFLKTSRPANAQDIEALRTLRGQIRKARVSTAGYLRSLREGKRTTSQLRKKNFSLSLNESARQLEGQQQAAARPIRTIVRGFKSAERQMTRRLIWYSTRGYLRRPPPGPPLSATDEPAASPPAE
jgi:hypothetical protein